ncbi:MAG: glutamate--tRNA ligase family protein [Minisyncoccia bacterium]
MSDSKGKVIVRMAPSPTGNLHIGGARTTLFNFLFARKMGGKFILRIEDTDKERSKKEFEENIIESLSWLDLKYDEIHKQSEREEIYKEYLKKMLDSGVAYISKEEPKEEGQRDEVIRFKNPNKKIIFQDLVRGSIEFDTTELGDFVVAKSVTEPLYHLAVVVDDHEMDVTHIIRGEEHLSNTPRQMLIGEAIGARQPFYAHIPLILAPDRSKLSKRAGAVSVLEYRDKGFLPQALNNYLALLGWNPGTEKEIFTLEELIKEFDIAKIHKGGAIFDEKKLEWVNKQHINLLSPEEKLKIVARDFDTKALPALDKNKICWKEVSDEDTLKYLIQAKEILENSGDLMAYAEREGKGNVLWPVRYALSGQEKSPDPFILISILGQPESLNRIEKAIELLS